MVMKKTNFDRGKFRLQFKYQDHVIHANFEVNPTILEEVARVAQHCDERQ